MWMVDDIPHYWGNVLIATGGILGTNYLGDNIDDNSIIVTSAPLPTTTTPEWSNAFAGKVLDVIPNDFTEIEVSNPMDSSMTRKAKFILATGT
jgi:hypothetical protein